MLVSICTANIVQVVLAYIFLIGKSAQSYYPYSCVDLNNLNCKIVLALLKVLICDSTVARGLRSSNLNNVVLYAKTTKRLPTLL